MIITKKYLKKVLDDTLTQMKTLGSYQFYVLITIFFLIINEYKVFTVLTLGFILGNLIIIPLRLKFFKERPIPKKYTNLWEKIKASSMPSGHALRSTILLLVLINFFGKELMMTVFLTLIYLVVMYTRIYFKRHHSIDLIVGIILGEIVWLFINYLLI